MKLKNQLNVEVFPTSLTQTNGEGHSLMEHLKRWFTGYGFVTTVWYLVAVNMVSAILGQNASPDSGDGCLILVPAGLDFSSVRKHNPI